MKSTRYVAAAKARHTKAAKRQIRTRAARPYLASLPPAIARTMSAALTAWARVR